MTLDSAPEQTKITSIKVLGEMDKEVKEKLPNNRDNDNRALYWLNFVRRRSQFARRTSYIMRTAVATTTAAAAAAAQTVRYQHVPHARPQPCPEGLSE